MANERAWLSTSRLEALTDGIFAFAMTLLVLSISLPDDPGGKGYMPNAELEDLILGESHRFLNYAIAFLLLAGFWMNHSREFHMIKATEHKHTWINILFLMFVALVPFTTALVGDYGQDWVAWLFFGANILILGIFLYMNWWYASRNRHLLHADVEEERIELGKRRGLVVPSAAVVSVAVSLSAPSLAGFVYMLIPIVLMLPWFHAGKKPEKKK